MLFGQFLEVLIGGLLAGVLYSLVALGFVLIFKASGVFNFAQGAMVLLAGLALVRCARLLGGAAACRMWAAIVLGLLFAGVIMAITAWLIERFVLGPLVNQDGLTLFMSTIGATFILEGAAQMIFGSDVYPLRLFPTDAWFLFESMFPGGILVNKLDVWGGLIAGVLVAGLAVFFQNTKTGRALRAVADDHAAAQSVGIPISWIWFVVWLVAGLVALVAATVWGTKLGVQFSITFLALEGAARAHHRRLHLGAGRHRRRAHRRRRREDRRGLPRAATSAAASSTGSPTCWRSRAAGAAAGPVRRAHHRADLRRSSTCSIAKPASSRPPTPRTWRCFRSARIASRSSLLLAVRLRRRAAAGQLPHLAARLRLSAARHPASPS